MVYYGDDIILMIDFIFVYLNIYRLHQNFTALSLTIAKLVTIKPIEISESSTI